MSLERKPLVLVVDDDPDLRMLVEMTVASSDAEVLATGDGESALDLASVRRPDLLVLDVMLPGALDGLAVCRRLKSELPHCFVVIVSGRSLESDVLDAEQSGADAYFVKPVSLLELGSLIERALRRRICGAQLPRAVGRPGHLRPHVYRG